MDQKDKGFVLICATIRTHALDLFGGLGLEEHNHRVNVALH